MRRFEGRGKLEMFYIICYNNIQGNVKKMEKNNMIRSIDFNSYEKKHREYDVDDVYKKNPK